MSPESFKYLMAAPRTSKNGDPWSIFFKTTSCHLWSNDPYNFLSFFQWIDMHRRCVFQNSTQCFKERKKIVFGWKTKGREAPLVLPSHFRKKSIKNRENFNKNIVPQIPKLWESKKYRDLAKKHIDGYAKRLHEIREQGGGPTFKRLYLDRFIFCKKSS